MLKELLSSIICCRLLLSLKPDHRINAQRGVGGSCFCGAVVDVVKQIDWMSLKANNIFTGQDGFPSFSIAQRCMENGLSLYNVVGHVCL